MRLRLRLRAAVATMLSAVVATTGAAAAGASELAQPPTYYPLCTSAQLAGFPWTHPAFGKSIPGIALRNMTLAPCRVAGFPTLAAYGSGGHPAAIRFEQRMFADTRIYAYTVVPGAAVFFALFGNPPHGEFDRSCVGIAAVSVLLPYDRRPIDVTLATGTCGRTMTVSQMFVVGELSSRLPTPRPLAPKPEDTR